MMESTNKLPLLPLIIDNQPVHSQDSVVVTNWSSNLDAEYVQYISADQQSAVAAVESSQMAFRSWSQTLPVTRRNILQKTAALMRDNRAALVKMQMEETNCAEMWAINNVNMSALHLEEIAGRITTALTGDLPVSHTPGQMGLVYKRPMGVILSIAPWNAAVILAIRAIDTALAVGCTVVFKASEQSPRTHHYLADLFRQAGLPPGVLNVVQVRREDAAAVTETLIAHRHIRKIEFIGSAAVGRHVGTLAGKYLKPVMLELGGKAASIVLEDAQLDFAAKAVVQGAFLHHGQICFSTERVIVHQAVADKFIPLLSQSAAMIPEPTAISPTGPARTLGMLKDAVSKGAKILYGDVKLLAAAKLQPVILADLTSDMEIYDEESFGPVLAVYIVHTDKEAIELVNSSKYGLSAAIHSKNVPRALKIAKELEVGATHINWPNGTGHDEPGLALGLSKGSGWGKQNQGYGLEEFLEIRTVTITDPYEYAATGQKH